MRQVVDQLHRWNFRLCGVFLLDSQFLIQASKFLAGVMTALSAMVTLELPHVNVLSKMDLLDKKAKKEIEKYTCLCYYQPSSSFSHTSPPFSPSPPSTHTHTLLRYLDPDTATLLSELGQGVSKKFHKLNKAITTLVSGYTHHFSVTRTSKCTHTHAHTD